MVIILSKILHLELSPISIITQRALEKWIKLLISQKTSWGDENSVSSWDRRDKPDQNLCKPHDASCL
jgi:hypothetical protein